MQQELTQEQVVDSQKEETPTETSEKGKEETSTETSEKGKASKNVDLASRIPEQNELGGYVTSKEASKMLSKHAGKDVPITTVNNLAYAGKIDAIKIAGIFLLKKDGDKSVTAYFPVIAEKDKNSLKRQEEKSRKNQQSKAMDAFKKHVNAAIAKGELPDIEALKKELGIA